MLDDDDALFWGVRKEFGRSQHPERTAGKVFPISGDNYCGSRQFAGNRKNGVFKIMHFTRKGTLNDRTINGGDLKKTCQFAYSLF